MGSEEPEVDTERHLENTELADEIRAIVRQCVSESIEKQASHLRKIGGDSLNSPNDALVRIEQVNVTINYRGGLRGHGGGLHAVWYFLGTLVTLIIALVTGFYLFENAGRYSPSVNTPFYYGLLVVLGLASALCLFGAMRSTATVSGRYLGAVGEFGGPAALFVAVVAGGLWATQRPAHFDLTVLLRGPGNPAEMAQDASIVIDLRTNRLNAEFAANGIATFKEIPADLRGETIHIYFNSPAFELSRPGSEYTIPSDGPLYLDVKASD